MAKTAAVYVRMSSEKQDSPARQRSLIEPYVRSRGHRVVAEYEDLEGKGWDKDRPGLQRLIRDAQAGRFDVPTSVIILRGHSWGRRELVACLGRSPLEGSLVPFAAD